MVVGSVGKLPGWNVEASERSTTAGRIASHGRGRWRRLVLPGVIPAEFPCPFRQIFGQPVHVVCLRFGEGLLREIEEQRHRVVEGRRGEPVTLGKEPLGAAAR